MLEVFVFAGLAEKVGAASVRLEVNAPIKVSEMKRTFATMFPETADQLPGCFAAVNQSYVDDDAIIQTGDEVALIPPVSGG